MTKDVKLLTWLVESFEIIIAATICGIGVALTVTGEHLFDDWCPS